MGDENKEVGCGFKRQEDNQATEDELEKANEARDRAMAAFSDGNFEDAVKEFTTAITLNPGSAMMHAKRAKYGTNKVRQNLFQCSVETEETHCCNCRL